MFVVHGYDHDICIDVGALRCIVCCRIVWWRYKGLFFMSGVGVLYLGSWNYSSDSMSVLDVVMR